MKIALVLFGQPRFVDNQNVINSYKHNILNKYDTDVYAHTWYEPDAVYEASSWAHMHKVKASNNTLEIIQEVYSPKKFVHEPPKEFSFSDDEREFLNTFVEYGFILSDRNYNNMLSQLYSIQSACNLVDNEEDYDFIILGRYDSVLHNFPDLNTLDPNKFYLQNNNPPFPDMIQVFGPKYMKWAKNVLDDLEDVIYEIHQPTPEGLKYATFKQYFNDSDLVPHRMYAEAIRK